MEYFLAGNIYQKDDQLSIHIILHETRTTKSMSERTFSRNNLLAIVDEMAVWIKEELSLPEITGSYNASV